MKGIRFLIGTIFDIPGDQQKIDVEGKWVTLPELLRGKGIPRETQGLPDWGDIKIDGEGLKNEFTGDFPEGFGDENENTV